MTDLTGNEPILHVMNTDENLFITGKAGTGKSTLLRLYIDNTDKTAVVLAPTGIAALNVEGSTIHKFFGFPPRLLKDEDLNLNRNPLIFRAVDTIIIDEISMVRADVFDAMDRMMRKYNESDEPFGGKQIILIGDLFQLPPVVTNEEEPILKSMGYTNPYIFSSKAFHSLNLRIIQLNQVYRQKDIEFVEILNQIRENKVDDDTLEKLNSRVGENQGAVILAPRNDTVNRYNNESLESLPSAERIYLAEFNGFNDNEFPTEKNLRLKVSARIIIIKNDPDGKYVNGSLGTIETLDDDSIEVRLDDNRLVTLERETWNKYKYQYDYSNASIETNTIGTFTQFPIKLGYALTIHKSQGQTLDKLFIDVSTGAFAHGQTYVALSRVRSIDTLYLKSPIKRTDVIVDEKITQFFKQYSNEESSSMKCRFSISGIPESILQNALNATIEMNKDISDYTGVFTLFGNTFELGQKNGIRCGVCNYFKKLIEKQDLNGTINYEICKKGNTTSNLKFVPTKEDENNEYTKFMTLIKEGVDCTKEIEASKILNKDDKETLLLQMM